MHSVSATTAVSPCSHPLPSSRSPAPLLPCSYGQQFDRTAVCRDPSTTLLLRVVDSCPCNYPSNAYSNKRWCCGDMDHMDIRCLLRLLRPLRLLLRPLLCLLRLADSSGQQAAAPVPSSHLVPLPLLFHPCHCHCRCRRHCHLQRVGL